MNSPSILGIFQSPTDKSDVKVPLFQNREDGGLAESGVRLRDALERAAAQIEVENADDNKKIVGLSVLLSGRPQAVSWFFGGGMINATDVVDAYDWWALSPEDKQRGVRRIRNQVAKLADDGIVLLFGGLAWAAFSFTFKRSLEAALGSSSQLEMHATREIELTTDLRSNLTKAVRICRLVHPSPRNSDWDKDLENTVGVFVRAIRLMSTGRVRR